jgi:tetratricopeptide (TPR) repeat protein
MLDRPARSKRSEGARRLATLAPLALLLPLTGCQKIQARIEFKTGNAFYKEGNYREALLQYQKGLELDPAATTVWRSVGLTAMALYRPGVEGAENLRHAQAAVDAFERYLRAFPADEKVEDYLLTVLVGLRRHDDALVRLQAKARANPGDLATQKAIGTTLVQAGRFPDALAHARKTRPRPDPEMLYAIGVACWDRAYNGVEFDEAARSAAVDLGLEATRQALEIKPDYFEAMAYYNLLFREKAKLATDPEEAQEWYAKAEEWTQKALALRELREKAAAAKPKGT